MDGDETVTVTIRPGTGYTVGNPESAVVTLYDDDVPVVSVYVLDGTASEFGPGTGLFRLSRTGSTAEPLTVHFVMSGTAVAGLDYQDVGMSVTFPAGADTVNVVVVPLDDLASEEDETVVLTISPGEDYGVGPAHEATVVILDDDV